jgi:dTDP-4-dehydrorhamnose 3,5-epimerase
VEVHTHSAGVTIVDICFCASDFGERGLKSTVAQANISLNCIRATSRGLQCQMPCAEAKLVRCTRGAIADVAVDIHPISQTYRRHASGMGFWRGATL